jgi:hypothetical protein
MKNPEEVYAKLLELSKFIFLAKAERIVCIADGSDWIWNLFAKLITELDIKDKTVLVADYFHAVEHLTEIAETDTKAEASLKQAWVAELAGYLKEGKFDLVKQRVIKEANDRGCPLMIDKFSYFDKRREHMRYDAYEEDHIPIGSGTVESAIKRVINHKLKSPGIFWKIENLERMLFIRCALLAGRWNIFMDNFFNVYRLNLPVA